MLAKTYNDSLSTTINDFIEGNLAPEERGRFIEHLKSDEQMRRFVRKSMLGKRALAQAYHVKAADDFGDKMSLRLSNEKKR